MGLSFRRHRTGLGSAAEAPRRSQPRRHQGRDRSRLAGTKPKDSGCDSYVELQRRPTPTLRRRLIQDAKRGPFRDSLTDPSDLEALDRDVLALIDRAEKGEKAMRVAAWNHKLQTNMTARGKWVSRRPLASPQRPQNDLRAP